MGVKLLLILYFIDYQLFRQRTFNHALQLQLLQSFFRHTLFFIYYISIYILISYKVLRKVFATQFFNCNNCNYNVPV